MGKYLKKFETQAAYEAAESSLILPNVSLTVDNNTVHYKPLPPTPVQSIVVTTYDVTDTSEPTSIGLNEYISGFSAIEIDGVELPTVVSSYTFSTTGEHTIRYTLSDPTTLGMGAFAGCINLVSAAIPSGVTTIGPAAFQQCTGLTSITLSEGLETIGAMAFSYTSFPSITIPSTVTSIGNKAFDVCTYTKTMTCNAMTAPTIESETFYNMGKNGTLYVPQGSTGYDVWMGSGAWYLGFQNWTKVEV